MLEETNEAVSITKSHDVNDKYNTQTKPQLSIKQFHKISKAKQRAKEQKITARLKDMQQPRLSTSFISVNVQRLKPCIKQKGTKSSAAQQRQD